LSFREEFQIMDDQTFTKNYLVSAQAVLATVDQEKLVQAIAILKEARKQGVTVFLAGNGGSAAICSHFTCDLNKTVLNPGENDKRFRAFCLNDNMPLLTAWANDTEYASVFSEPLKNHARAGDVVIIISSGGKSPNIIRAATTAKELGCKLIGLSGIKGNPLSLLSDVSLNVESSEYGHVECTHEVMCHLMTFALKGSAAMIKA
jgi:D-sedoheptulose 7-phosphate isomerase